MRAVLASLVLIAGAAPANEVEVPMVAPQGQHITLNDEQVRHCAQGCYLVSPAEMAALKERMLELIERAVDAGKKHEREECRRFL